MLARLLSKKTQTEPTDKETQMDDIYENSTSLNVELTVAYSQFNEVTDSELVDACIHRINQLEHLISKNINVARQS